MASWAVAIIGLHRYNALVAMAFVKKSFLFLIGTAIVVTATRISYGIEGLLTSRYKIYSILLLITIYLIFITKVNLNNKKLLVSFLIFMAICFNIVVNYINFKEIVNFRNQLISFGINWELDEKISDTKPEVKLYEMPKLSLENSFSEIKKPIKNALIWKERITKTVSFDGVLIQNNSFNVPTKKEDNISLIVQSKTKTYLMPSKLMNYPIKAFVRTGKYWQNGFVGVLNNNEFENGIYQLGIFIKNGQNIQKYYLNDSIMVNNQHSNPLKTNW